MPHTRRFSPAACSHSLCRRPRLGTIARAAAVAATLVLRVGTASADTLALDPLPGTLPVSCPSCYGSLGTTVGWVFTTSLPLTVTGLAAWDALDDGPGLNGPSAVALWQVDNVTTLAHPLLLAQTTMTDGSSPLASAGDPEGRWLVERLAQPLTLASGGTYALGQWLVAPETLFSIAIDAHLAPGVQLVYGLAGQPDEGLTVTQSKFESPMLGPSLLLAAPVPEPSTFGLAALGALLTIGVATRQRLR